MLRTMTVGLCLAALWAAGSLPAAEAPRAAASEPASLPFRAPRAPSPLPAEYPADANVMAYINGKPVPMSELNDLMLRNYGLKIAQQLLGTELVRQEAEKEKIEITDADVLAETDLVMKQMFGQVQGADQRERFLKQMLSSFQISREHWTLSMRRNAMLTKLAEKRVKVTDEDVQEEFKREYGKKVVVRHIQVESWSEAQRLRKALDDGADFARLARENSKSWSARDGGLLPPIDPKSKFLPPVMREVALNGLHKVGEISQIVEVGTSYHVLKLERVIESQDVKLGEVKAQLAENVRQRQIAILKQEIPQDLFEKAKKDNAIQFVNPILRSGYEDAIQGNQP